MFSEKVENFVTIVEETNNGIKLISASQAFRRYNWLREMPRLNDSGNLRGMVVSAKWRTAYKITGNFGQAIQNATLLIKFYEEAKRSQAEMEKIFMSNAAWEIKAAKISTQVSGICIRTLKSLVTGSVKTMNWVLRKTKSVNAIYWVDKALGFNEFDKSLNDMEALVNHIDVFVEQKTVGDGLYNFIEVRFR